MFVPKVKEKFKNPFISEHLLQDLQVEILEEMMEKAFNFAKLIKSFDDFEIADVFLAEIDQNPSGPLAEVLRLNLNDLAREEALAKCKEVYEKESRTYVTPKMPRTTDPRKWPRPDAKMPVDTSRRVKPRGSY